MRGRPSGGAVRNAATRETSRIAASSRKPPGERERRECGEECRARRSLGAESFASPDAERSQHEGARRHPEERHRDVVVDEAEARVPDVRGNERRQRRSEERGRPRRRLPREPEDGQARERTEKGRNERRECFDREAIGGAESEELRERRDREVEERREDDRRAARRIDPPIEPWHARERGEDLEDPPHVVVRVVLGEDDRVADEHRRRVRGPQQERERAQCGERQDRGRAAPHATFKQILRAKPTRRGGLEAGSSASGTVAGGPPPTFRSTSGRRRERPLPS